MNTQPYAKFEVTSHLEISGRGAFVIGHVREGMIRIGASVPLPDSTECWTISAVEFVDKIPERKHWNALLFKELPELGDVEAAFPVGSFMNVCDEAPDAATES